MRSRRPYIPQANLPCASVESFVPRRQIHNQEPGQDYPAALVPITDAHPEVAGTLCASGAGLSRPGGMASESDLCTAYEQPVYAIQGNMIGRQDRNGPQGSGINKDLSFTLTSTDVGGVAAKRSDNEPIPINDRATRHIGGGETRKGDGCGNGLGVGKPGDPSPTLSTGDKHAVAGIFNHQRSDMFKAQDIASNQSARQYKGPTDLIFRVGYIIRRLTPTECERLQGFPDGWTSVGHDGKEISDTRRYQMLGNSVAIPCVAFVLGNISAQIFRQPG